MNDVRRSSIKFANIFSAFLFLAGGWWLGCVRETGSPPLDTLPTEEQVAIAKADVETAKASMMHDGKYNCCIKPACDYCLLKAKGCACADLIDADQPVCTDCGLGWKNGKGSIPDVEPSEVKNVLESR
ncbi:hypothetical protein L0337_37535 [candidate division KSB1 bacterium]|nr:hypothetical protein [candidate division KSB1 bacterium]